MLTAGVQWILDSSVVQCKRWIGCFGAVWFRKILVNYLFFPRCLTIPFRLISIYYIAICVWQPPIVEHCDLYCVFLFLNILYSCPPDYLQMVYVGVWSGDLCWLLPKDNCDCSVGCLVGDYLPWLGARYYKSYVYRSDCLTHIIHGSLQKLLCNFVPPSQQTLCPPP